MSKYGLIVHHLQFHQFLHEVDVNVCLKFLVWGQSKIDANSIVEDFETFYSYNPIEHGLVHQQ